MKFIFMIFYLSILSTIFANTVNPKLCIHCKFFKNNLISGAQFGKCLLFIEKKENENEIDFLVNGKKNNNNIDYKYCSIARKYDQYCGKEGKFYEEKKKIKFFN